jgi:hypothetical protein
MTSRQATRTLVPWLAILTIPGLFATQAPAAPPDPVDILSVTSTASALEVVHSPVPDGVRRSVYKLDRAEGYWKRRRMRYAGQSGIDSFKTVMDSNDVRCIRQ